MGLSMNHDHKLYVGIDVSKAKLDVASTHQKRVQTFSYTPDGLQQLIQVWEKSPPQLVCLEATGGLERTLVKLLNQNGIPNAVVNPRQIRDFARATNQLAKTDAIDARVIARFAQTMTPSPTPPLTLSQQKLRDFIARKRQVTKLLVQEKNRLATTTEPCLRDMVEQAIGFYNQQLLAITQQIQELIEQDKQAQEKAKLIESVPGLGTATAALLVSELPELGALNRQQIARLVGVAPTNRDSGTLRGKRTTGGGRVQIRNALYMPTVVAIRYNPTIKAFYQRLVQNGKPKMVALIAAMRKLLTILNVMIQNQHSSKFQTNYH